MVWFPATTSRLEVTRPSGVYYTTVGKHRLSVINGGQIETYQLFSRYTVCRP